MSHIIYSGFQGIWAQKDGDYVYKNFPGTGVGLQSAIDYLAGGKGEVVVGPGTLLTNTAIWIHSYCRLRGSGRGVTIIQRQTGSILDTDAANSGAVLATSAYGANGTLSNSAAVLRDIEISDLTLDGNSQSFSALTSGTPHQAGLLAQSVDGLTVRNVEIKQTLRSGLMTMECKKVIVTGLRTKNTGQIGISTTKNAVDFYNYLNSTAGHGVDFVLSDFIIDNDSLGTSQVAVSCTNVQRVVISNGTIKNNNVMIELQGNSVASSIATSKILIENIVGSGFDQKAFLLAGVSGAEVSHVIARGCDVEMAAIHSDSVIDLANGVNTSIYDVLFEGCTFRNCNALDSSTQYWVNADSNTSGVMHDIILSGCSFYGKAGSTRTSDAALRLTTDGMYNFSAINCYFRDVAGIGVSIRVTSAGATVDRLTFNSVVIDGSNNYGFHVAADAGGGCVCKNIRFTNCVAKDSVKQTGDSGFRLLSNASASTVSNCRFSACSAFKTAGTSMLYGLDIRQNAGSVDDIEISGCDFSRVQTSMFKPAPGAMTNTHFIPRAGRGSDIASSATISIPTDGTVFHVTGNNNITNGITVNAWDSGRVILLVFDGTLTVSDTGTSKLSAAFSATADDTLTLACDGTNWYETARSVN